MRTTVVYRLSTILRGFVVQISERRKAGATELVFSKKVKLSELGVKKLTTKIRTDLKTACSEEGARIKMYDHYDYLTLTVDLQDPVNAFSRVEDWNKNPMSAVVENKSTSLRLGCFDTETYTNSIPWSRQVTPSILRAGMGLSAAMALASKLDRS